MCMTACCIALRVFVSMLSHLLHLWSQLLRNDVSINEGHWGASMKASMSCRWEALGVDETLDELSMGGTGRQ